MGGNHLKENLLDEMLVPLELTNQNTMQNIFFHFNTLPSQHHNRILVFLSHFTEPTVQLKARNKEKPNLSPFLEFESSRGKIIRN